MSREKTISRIRDVMRDVFDVEDLEITDTTSAADVEEWDSLSHIRLVVAIEREFSVQFSNSEIEDMQNVGDLADFLERKA